VIRRSIVEQYILKPKTETWRKPMVSKNEM
jgi:hypothetical protein